jgi:glycosyltransferase involved in cell wall biosynthesis
MKDLKVLHIITGLNTGGAEMMLYKLCCNKSLDIDYKIISLTSIGPIGDKIKKTGVEVISIGFSKNPLSLLKGFRLIKEINSYKPDVIQTWLYHSDLIGGIIGWLLRIPVFWNIRQASVNRKLNKWHTVLASRICGIISFIPKKILSCTNKGIEEHSKIGYPKSKMHFIPNGFETEKYLLDTKLKDDLILHVGRYAPLKDHKTFIEVAKKLHLDFPNFRFEMYGDGVDNTNQSLNNGLPDYIRLMGRNNNLENVYPRAKLLISTSLSEGFSNTIGEAMLCGVPVVATPAGDTELIVDNQNNIADFEDIESLYQKAKNILNESQDYQIYRKSIVSRFDIKVIAKKYEEIYRSII